MKKFTSHAKSSDNPQNWYVVDATDLVLGRLASNIAIRLRGKNAVNFTPHADAGDFIVVINAEKIRLTGRKLAQKKYYRHSGYMGGIKEITADKLMAKRPEDIIRFAVKGMLPKTRLGSSLYKKLKVYSGESHPHEAQQPQELVF